jgi:VIT1/CCC1 family predicted Fe2+/Mn2+ transporter
MKHNLDTASKLENEHTAHAIRDRLGKGGRQNYLRDFVYGGIDGAVTTFAIVAGTIGANLSTKIVLILGTANLIADGFSMAASNFLGTRAEREDHERLRLIELHHIDTVPDGEREEIRQIYAKKGFADNELDRVVELITNDRERWVQTMLTEEYGLAREVRSEWQAAASTFAAFVVCGLVPLLPFVFGQAPAFSISAVLTAVVFFLIGSAKAYWSPQPWWRSGASTFAVGAIAALLAYIVGVMLRSLGA